MANYNVEIQRFNGSSYDVIYNTANLRKGLSSYIGTGTTNPTLISEKVQIFIICANNETLAYPYPVFPFVSFNPYNSLMVTRTYNLFIESASKITPYLFSVTFLGENVEIYPTSPGINSTIENKPEAFYNKNGQKYFLIYFY